MWGGCIAVLVASQPPGWWRFRVLASDRMVEVLRYGFERFKLLRRWREIAARVAGKVRERFLDAEVYVFSSVVEGVHCC